MATFSLDELTKRMQGKSITLGWDAVVFWERDKVNALIEQRYIATFNENSFLKRISGQVPMTPDGREYLEFSGLILSAPRIHFHKATLQDSKATAIFDISAGAVSYINKGGSTAPGSVIYSYEVSAELQRTLVMDIDLAEGQGAVNKAGEVIFDIGDGYECECNLVSEPKAQKDLGNWFKALFLAQKPEDRQYVIGKLDLRDVDLLAPRTFMLRTMTTDEGRNRNSRAHGEGAVVALIQAKGSSKPGDPPTSKSLDYLLPNDQDAQGKHLYSGTVVIASRVLFDWYVRDAIQKIIGGNLRLESTQSNHVAKTLTAIAGGFDLPGFEFEWHSTIAHAHYFRNNGPLMFKLYDVLPERSLRVMPNEEYSLELSLIGERLLPFHVRVWWWLPLDPDEDYYFNGLANATVKVILEPVLTTGFNRVTFERKSDPVINFQRDWDPEKRLDHVTDEEGKYILTSLDEMLTPAFLKILEVFKHLQIPEINTLAVSNLIFPNENALTLTEARLPGDLLMVGHIDRKKTTFTLDPLLPTVKAGAKQVFTIRELAYKAENVTWSVRGIDGARAVGAISNGEFTAPGASLLNGMAVRNVVTATYTDPQSGKEVTASAMATVTMAGVLVQPSFRTVYMDDRRSVDFTAFSQGTGPFKWTSSGPGTLVPNGGTATYAPPSTDLPDGGLQVVLIEVEDTSSGEKASGSVLLRQGAFVVDINPPIVTGLRPEHSVLLKPPSNIPPELLKWEVMAGGGSIEPQTGKYTAPKTISAPYAVVRTTLEDVFLDRYGYSVIKVSEHARVSEWFSLGVFEFQVNVNPHTVYANGLMQVAVVVRIRPDDVDGVPKTLSEDEYDSIRLVSADNHIALPEVGKDGVPEGDKWHYTLAENKKYEKYPHQLSNAAGPFVDSAEVETKIFYVQCHKVEDLLIAAMLRSDNGETFYSNPQPSDGENNKKVIRLVAVQPPAGGAVGRVQFTFREADGVEGPIRVKGDKDNDNDLNTLDHYHLKLIVKDVQTAIKDIVWVDNMSTLMWESKTMLEDIHSLTGYAMYGDVNDLGHTILHIDDILYRRLGGELPSRIVDSKSPARDGQVLLTLERRQYWRYDKYASEDFDKPLRAFVFDMYGNKHPVGFSFFGNDRNKLIINA